MQIQLIITIIVAVLFLAQGALLQFGLVDSYAMFILTGVCFLICFLNLKRR